MMSVDEKELLGQYIASQLSNPKYNSINNLLRIKERIRTALRQEAISVSLEDVFTSIDKSISQHTHTRNYTYQSMDSIKHAILRLFIYYFARILRNHSYDNDDYAAFTQYVRVCKNNTTIITTNWDTLIEDYLSRNNIGVNMCFNEPYYKYDSKLSKRRRSIGGIKTIKVHGSINWFKCLQCGSLSIIDRKKYGQYLFDDNIPEKCVICGEESGKDDILLQPEIITQSMIKTIDSQLYRNLWNAAAAELRQAKRIIFVGYSLPLADYEFRYFLQNNISGSANVHIVLQTNDDPLKISHEYAHLRELLPEQRYKDAFSANELSFYYNGMKGYFSEVVKTMKALP
jgi:NAD-dependent SIR2 family protein deacetylase